MPLFSSGSRPARTREDLPLPEEPARPQPVELELGKQLPDVFIAAVKEVGVLLLK